MEGRRRSDGAVRGVDTDVTVADIICGTRLAFVFIGPAILFLG